MSSFNGEKYIEEQIKTILSQKGEEVDLYINDDGSTDNTVKIIKSFNSKNIFLTQIKYDNFYESFLNTLLNVPDNYEYYAFSDQDDIWNEKKIEKAISFIKVSKNKAGALYGSRTLITDAYGKILTKGKKNIFKPSFANCLVQNMFPGNTMVFTQEVKNLIRKCGNFKFAISHDWYIYIVSAANGVDLMLDNNAYIKYRQHGDNAIGENISFFNSWQRLVGLFSGQIKDHRYHISEILSNAKINDKHLKTYAYWKNIDSPLPKRLLSIFGSGIYRRNIIETIALYIAAIFKKI